MCLLEYGISKEEIDMTLAEYLKSYREQQGISQKELAEIISVSPAKVSRMEAGESSGASTKVGKTKPGDGFF